VKTILEQRSDRFEEIHRDWLQGQTPASGYEGAVTVDLRIGRDSMQNSALVEASRNQRGSGGSRDVSQVTRDV